MKLKHHLLFIDLLKQGLYYYYMYKFSIKVLSQISSIMDLTSKPSNRYL